LVKYLLLGRNREEIPVEIEDFKSDYDSVAEIGLYELRNYAIAVKNYEKMSLERKELFKSLYGKVSPSLTGVDYDEGCMFVLAQRTESIALRIIDEKRLYDAKMAKEKRKAEMFEAAMKHLSEMEREVIRIRYHAKRDETNTSLVNFYSLINRAERKLIKVLTNECQKRLDEIRKALFEEILEDKKCRKVETEKIRIREPCDERR
jgi:hypothetical protein